MNVFIKTLLFLYFIGHFNTTNVMFSTKFKSLASTRAIRNKIAQHTYTTKQPTIQPINRSTTSLWDKLSNWLFKPIQEPILLQQINPQIAPLSIALVTIPKTPSAQLSIDTITSLPQAKKLLKSQEKTERRKQKIIFNITTPEWQKLLAVTKQHHTWIKNTCFKIKNLSITSASNIPKKFMDRISFFFNKAHINPSSVNILWKKITASDIFGHKKIVTSGPILKDITTELTQIPTITLDPDEVNKLSPEEFDAELYHAITHLTEGHHDQLNVLHNAVGTEQYDKYVQSSEGKKFLNTLEATANFLMPLDDVEVAKIAQKSSITSVLNLTLSAIESDRKQHNLENTKTDEIVCLNPSNQLSFLNEIKALPEINEYFKNQLINIYKSLGLSNEQIKILKNEFIRSCNEINQHYKQPQEKKDHDQSLPSFQLKWAEKLLQQTGIEPSSIIIKALPREMSHMGGSVDIQTSINSEGKKTFTTTLSLYPAENLEEYHYRSFIIAHEIGHILKNHCIENMSFSILGEDPFDWGNKTSAEKFKIRNLFALKATLFELEADAFAALLHESIATTNYTALLEKHKTEKSSHTHMWQNIGDPTYLKTVERIELYKKIVELHTLERKPFIPDITRE